MIHTFLKGKCSPPLENRPQAPARGGELALCKCASVQEKKVKNSKQKVKWPSAEKKCKDLLKKKLI